VAKIFYDHRFAQDGWNCRFSIADGHWKELPHHFFNRQSAIGNENLVFGCGRRRRRPWLNWNPLG